MHQRGWWGGHLDTDNHLHGEVGQGGGGHPQGEGEEVESEVKVD